MRRHHSNDKNNKEKVYSIKLWDRRITEYKIKHPPEIFVARGFGHHLPFLCSGGGRPLICISDWQYETETQKYFWQQALPFLEGEVDKELLERSIVIVAGDMASCNNRLLGTASDDVPNLRWLYDSFPKGDVFMIYGNHDNMSRDHLIRYNEQSSNLPCLLPHGKSISMSTTTLSNNNNDNNQSSSKKQQLAIKFQKAISDLVPDAANCDNNDNLLRRNTKESRKMLKKNVTNTNPKVNITPGMTKEQRAAQYAKIKFDKVPKKTKLQKQNRQWRQQNSNQVYLVECMKNLHRKLYDAESNKNDNLEQKGEGKGKEEEEGKENTITKGEILFDGENTKLVDVDYRNLMKPTDVEIEKIPSNSCCDENVNVTIGIGAVHGIPASHHQGMKKIERSSYFEALSDVCSSTKLDILVTHSNPVLPGQEEKIKGDDAKRIYSEFLRSSARLHVHGHMHSDPAITILPEEGNKVVVNSDCRVVLFVP